MFASREWVNLKGGLMDLKFSVIVEDLEWICCFSDGNSTFNIGSEGPKLSSLW